MSLDDIVTGVLPAVLRPDPPTTVRMLLDHSSGIFNVGDEGDVAARWISVGTETSTHVRLSTTSCREARSTPTGSACCGEAEMVRIARDERLHRREEIPSRRPLLRKIDSDDAAHDRAVTHPRVVPLVVPPQAARQGGHGVTGDGDDELVERVRSGRHDVAQIGPELGDLDVERAGRARPLTDRQSVARPIGDDRRGPISRGVLQGDETAVSRGAELSLRPW